MNNLLGVLTGFRNGRVGAAADLNKFHNQVYLVDEDVHMQRFFWRGMNTEIAPQTYAVPVVNFGVKPANCIATCALRKSADRFASSYPVESDDVKNQTYIDDTLIAAASDEEIREKATRIDEICADAGMENKGWVFSGDCSNSDHAIGGETGDLEEQLLGMLWSARTDKFSFNIVLRFKIEGVEVEVTCLWEFENIRDKLVLTRRVLTSNIARIFDPVGFLCALLLQGKLLMRELWSFKDIGWDDPIPSELSEKWINFLLSLLKVVEVKLSLIHI